MTPRAPIVSEPEKINVLDSWSSSLDLLNLNGHQFAIRQTQHINDKAEVTTIRLNRLELERLIKKVQEALSA